MTATSDRLAPTQAPAPGYPLASDDPPRLGSYWLEARIAADAAGIVYLGVSQDGERCRVLMMTEGSYADAAARERFALAVGRLPAPRVLDRNSGDDDDLTSWAALREAGDDEAGTPNADELAADVLAAVLLSRVPHVGTPRGPDFLHHFDRRRRAGLFRLWPLPWPTSLRAASRAALVWALTAMILLMVLLIFLAWLLWRNQPPVTPPPPIPTTVTSTVPASPTPSSPNSSPQSPSSGPSSPGGPSSLPTGSLSPGGNQSDLF